MAKKKSSVSSKNVHHMHLQHNFSGSAVAVVGGLLLVFALVLFVANNNFKKSGMSTEYYYDDSGMRAIKKDIRNNKITRYVYSGSNVIYEETANINPV